MSYVTFKRRECEATHSLSLARVDELEWNILRPPEAICSSLPIEGFCKLVAEVDAGSGCTPEPPIHVNKVIMDVRHHGLQGLRLDSK